MPNRTSRSLAALAAGALLPLLARPLAAQSAPAPLSQSGTEALVGRFGDAGHWMQKVVILLSLNTWWHPSGAGMALSRVSRRACAR